jgi:hypothetical protein
MAISSDIRRRGFAKWYERELLRGHAHLVLVLLALLGVLGAVEAFGQPGAPRPLLVLALLTAMAVVLWAVRRYLFHLGRAELLANQASCPGCGVYARWRIDDEPEAAERRAGAAGSDDRDDEAGGAAMQVVCRRCEGRWRIEW